MVENQGTKESLGEAVVVRASQMDYIAASHEDHRDPSALKKVLLDSGAKLKGQIQMVNWAKLLKGRSFLPHYHEDMSEIFVIMKGEAAIIVSGKEYRLSPGDLILVPPNSIHAMTAFDKDVEYIVFGCSAGLGGKTVNVDISRNAE